MPSDFGSLSPGAADPSYGTDWVSLARQFGGDVASALSSHFGIPREVRNAQGDRVFLTNAFERFIGGFHDASYPFLSFAAGPGLRGGAGGDFMPLPENAVRLPGSRPSPSSQTGGTGNVVSFPRTGMQKYADAFKAQRGYDYTDETDPPQQSPYAQQGPYDDLMRVLARAGMVGSAAEGGNSVADAVDDWTRRWQSTANWQP